MQLLFNLVSGDLKILIFLINNFFFQLPLCLIKRFLTLFLLRKFRSVADLIFKCLEALPKLNFYRDS